MRRLRRWLLTRWAPVVTVAIAASVAVISAVALRRDRPGTVLPAVAIGVTLALGIWSLEFVRREFHIRSRPYLAVTAARAEVTETGDVAIIPVMTNAGAMPGVMETQRVSTVVAGVETELPKGETETNIIYPNERVNIGVWHVPPGGRVKYATTYSGLDGVRSYQFAIEYSASLVGGQPQAAIVSKSAT